MKLRRRSALAGAAALSVSPAVRAQDFPSKPIKIVVPFAAGSATDLAARGLGAKLQESLGQAVVIENKPGGASVVGAAIAAKSPPDGQTWMITFDSHILNPAFAPSIPYKDS